MIYSNSQAAIKTINPICSQNHEFHTSQIKASVELSWIPFQVQKSQQITLAWVPGHEGHQRNEGADKVAYKGTITALIELDLYYSSVTNL